MEILSGASPLSSVVSIQFLFKADGNPPWDLPPPVHASYPILIYN
jgi:hypothetical protein